MTLLQTTIGTEDIWVTIVTILFALSMISERIANLIKLYVSDLRVKRYHPASEKKRERGIVTLVVSCGIGVAVLAGADFFELISTGHLVSISAVQNGRSILGFILSGFFISLGSKFWHDTLDIVLQFSNLKKCRSDERMHEAKEELDETNRAVQKELKAKAEIILPKLQQWENFAGFNIIKNEQNQMKLKLQFVKSIPNENELKWVENFFGKDNFTTENLTSKPGLHVN